jgi:hypothetical protein
VFRVTAEFQDVALGGSKMLEQLPRRIGTTLWAFPSQSGRQTLESCLGVDVSAASAEEIEQMFPESVHIQIRPEGTILFRASNRTRKVLDYSDFHTE